MENKVVIKSLKHPKYNHLTLKEKIKTKVKPLIFERDAIINEEAINKLNFYINDLSKYNDIENHATINFKSVGKNTFINILYNNDRIIYNKSIGKLKINNVKIKKKEKNIKKNLFTFSKEFTDHFFTVLQEKYKIKNISINFIAKSENYYTFKKFFFYRIIGLFYKRARISRTLNYKKNLFKNILDKEYPYVGRGFKGRGYSPYESKKPEWYHKNTITKIAKYISTLKTVNIINIKFINKYPYNGCKKKKIRKI